MFHKPYSGVWLCVGIAMLMSIASANSCEDRDISLEQEGLGAVYADNLDYSGDMALLDNACFDLYGWHINAGKIGLENAQAYADDIQLSQLNITGTALQGVQNQDTWTLSQLQLAIQVTDSATAMYGLQLKPGLYHLSTPEAVWSNQGLYAEQAVLIGDQQQYLVHKVAILDGQVQAERLEISSEKANIIGQDVHIQNNSAHIQSSQVSICQSPNWDELALNIQDLRLENDNIVWNNSSLVVFGLRYPLGAGQLSLASAQQQLDGLSQWRAPELVLGDRGSYGLRNFSLPNAASQSWTLLQHPNYTEFHVDGSQLNDYWHIGSYQTAWPELRFGREQANGDLAQVDLGLTTQQLKRVSLGYAWQPFRISAGMAQQNTTFSPYLQAQANYALGDAQQGLNLAAGAVALNTGYSAYTQWDAHWNTPLWTAQSAATLLFGDQSVPALQPDAQQQHSLAYHSPQFGASVAYVENAKVGQQLNSSAYGHLDAYSLYWNNSLDVAQQRLSSDRYGVSMRIPTAWGSTTPKVSFDRIQQAVYLDNRLRINSDCWGFDIDTSVRYPFDFRLKLGMQLL